MEVKHSEQHITCPMTQKIQIKVTLTGLLDFLQLLALLLGVLFLSVAAVTPIVATPGRSHKICSTTKCARWARGLPSPLRPKIYPAASTQDFHFQSAYLILPETAFKIPRDWPRSHLWKQKRYVSSLDMNTLLSTR